MTDITSFFEWFFDNLPYFLMSDPIKYFTGFVVLGFAAKFLVELFRGVR